MQFTPRDPQPTDHDDLDAILAGLPEMPPDDDPSYYLDGAARPLLAIVPDKFERGFSPPDKWAWPRTTRSPGGIADAYEVVGLSAALSTSYKTDAHFVPYVVVGKGGRVLARQPRLTVASLTIVKSAGFDVRVTAQVADVDNPDHATWTPETLREAIGKLSHPSLACCSYYTTTRGLRIIRVLDRWLSIEEHRVTLPPWLDQLAAIRLDPDRACIDWTRHFRLPRVVRDGKATKPGGKWTWTPYRVGNVEIPKPPMRTEREKLLSRMARTTPKDERVIDRA